MKRYERDGRWCEVGKLEQTVYEGVPCQTISGRGDHDFYLGGAATLLAIDERLNAMQEKRAPFVGGQQLETGLKTAHKDSAGVERQLSWPRIVPGQKRAQRNQRRNRQERLQGIPIPNDR
jgi:hypothetical protein